MLLAFASLRYSRGRQTNGRQLSRRQDSHLVGKEERAVWCLGFLYCTCTLQCLVRNLKFVEKGNSLSTSVDCGYYGGPSMIMVLRLAFISHIKFYTFLRIQLTHQANKSSIQRGPPTRLSLGTSRDVSGLAGNAGICGRLLR